MKIVLKNNLRLSDIDPDLEKELIHRLTFANPKWLENHKMGRWNRGVQKELKYFDRIRGGKLWIPRGFMRQLILLCRRYKVSYEIDDQRHMADPVDFEFSGTLRPFQEKAVNTMLAKDFGTLSAPTGSGKTVMALYMVAVRKQPCLIVVHTKDLAHQWKERAKMFLHITEDDIGYIGGGKKSFGHGLTIALVQSLYKCADEAAKHTGFLIVDECHRCPSRTFTEAVSAFDSRYMLGLSATPWRRDQLSKLIFWYLGDVHHEIEKAQLVASGDVLAADVVFRTTDFEPSFDPVNEYSKMLSELTLNDTRNRLIAADIAKEADNQTGVCLVLSDRKKHCETLQAILKYKHKLEASVLTGDLSMDERKQVLDQLNQGDIKVLIATGQLIGEGFDAKALSLLFLATPIRFSGRLLQYIGRVLRPGEGKQKAKIYDYVDIKVEVLLASARARQRVYGIFPHEL